MVDCQNGSIQLTAGEVCSMERAKSLGIYDDNPTVKITGQDYNDYKTYNDTFDNLGNRTKTVCTTSSDDSKAYRNCIDQFGMGYVRKSGTDDTCVVYDCPDSSTGFKKDGSSCKKPLADATVSIQENCDEAWNDWFTINNYHLGNGIYQKTTGVCYSPCSPYEIPFYAKDPIDGTPLNFTSDDDQTQCISKADYFSGKYANDSEFCPLAWIYRIGQTKEDFKEIIKEQYLNLKNDDSKVTTDAYIHAISENSLNTQANNLYTTCNSLYDNVLPPSQQALTACKKLYTIDRLNKAYNICNNLKTNETEFTNKLSSDNNDPKVLQTKKTILKQACTALFCNNNDSSALSMIGKNQICFDKSGLVPISSHAQNSNNYLHPSFLVSSNIAAPSSNDVIKKYEPTYTDNSHLEVPSDTSKSKLVKMIYLSIFLIIDSLVWIVLYIFSKEYLVPYIVKPFLISVLSLSPTPGMGPILNYIKDTEGEIRKAYRDNGDVPEVNPSYKLLSIIVSGILNLVIVIIFLKYGKINKQINWLNNISNQRT